MTARGSRYSILDGSQAQIISAQKAGEEALISQQTGLSVDVIAAQAGTGRGSLQELKLTEFSVGSSGDTGKFLKPGATNTAMQQAPSQPSYKPPTPGSA